MGVLVRHTTYPMCMLFLSLSISSFYGYLYNARTAADPAAAHCNTYLMTNHLLGTPSDSVPCRQIGLEGRYQKTPGSAQHVYDHGLVLLET